MKKFIRVTLLSIFLFALTMIPSYAQDNASLGYAPTSEYLNLQPGETYDDFFTVWNLSEETITYYVYVSGFHQIEDFPGTSIPISPEDDAKDPYSASDWLTVEIDKIDLRSNVDEDINYTITVPEDIALGEYTVKVFLSTDKEFDYSNQSGAIANLASGPSILIQVGALDQLTEELDLLTFTSDKAIYEKPPVLLLTEIENTGNTHVTPKGDIVITNIFNQEVARFPLNGSDISTLRGQIAKYETKWETNRQILTTENKIMFGPMKAELISTYKTVNPGYYPILSETNFWIIPWKILLAIIVAVILISIGIKVKNNGSKKKNRTKKEE